MVSWLKLIAEQNLIIMGLLQHIFLYMGMDKKQLDKIMKEVQQQVEREINQ